MHIFIITYKKCNPRNQSESISTGIKHIMAHNPRIWRSWPATMWHASVDTLDMSSKKEGGSKNWPLCRTVTWSCCNEDILATDTDFCITCLFLVENRHNFINKKLRQWLLHVYLSEIFSLMNIPDSNCEINKKTSNPRCKCGRFWCRQSSCSKFRCPTNPTKTKSSTQRPNGSRLGRFGVKTSSAACVSSIRVASHAGNLGPAVWWMWCHVALCWTVYTSFISNIKLQLGTRLYYNISQNWWLQLPFPLGFRFELRNFFKNLSRWLQVSPFHPVPQLRAEHVGDGCTVSAVSVSVQKAKQKALCLCGSFKAVQCSVAEALA